MRYLSQALAYWPVFLLAALWLVVGVVALFYALSTRRPIFLFSGLAALLLMMERLLSPARFLLHYLSTHTFYGGKSVSAIRIEFLFGAFKYEWLIDGLAVILLLLGLILEVRRARRRAIRSNAAQASGAAAGAPLAAGAAPAGRVAQPPAQGMTNYTMGAAPGAATLPDYDQPTRYQRPPSGSGSPPARR